MSKRQELTNFLIKYEIFKRILNVHGSIIEGGMGEGDGLLTWAYLSAILEPVNHTRRVIGFDTFTGFPAVSGFDGRASVGDMRRGSKKEIEGWVRILDEERWIGHIPKVEIIEGDACETIPRYVKDNPHLVISLLYLDFDIYQPTETALKWFMNRMPKGAIIAFDELNVKEWPGETLAVHKMCNLSELRIERCSFGSTISWAQL